MPCQPIDQLRKSLLEQEKARLRALEGQLADLTEERDRVINCQEVVPYRDMPPVHGYERKAHHGPRLAKKYAMRFEHNDPTVPLANTWFGIDNKGEDYKPGDFKEDRSKLEQGVFNATYIPAWWGYKQDKTAVVHLEVQKKYTAESKNRAAYLDVTISKLKDKLAEDGITVIEKGYISQCKDVINGHEARIRLLDQSILKNKKSQKVVEDTQMAKKALLERLNELDKEQQHHHQENSNYTDFLENFAPLS